jgi:hypothetical protein
MPGWPARRRRSARSGNYALAGKSPLKPGSRAVPCQSGRAAGRHVARSGIVNNVTVEPVAFSGTIAAMNPLSGVLGESWQLYRAHARHLLTIAFVIYIISAIISALLREVGGLFGVLLADLITLIALYLLQAALVKAVQDVRDGTTNLSVGQTFSAAAPYLGPVAIASIVAAIAITIGLVLIIIPGLFLITIWCLIVPAIVLEGAGTFASFGRSWQLVRGHFWNVFGTLFLVFVILFVLELILGLIFGALPTVLGGFLASVIGGTLVAPFIAVVITLIYFRLTAADTQTAASGSWGGSASYPPAP